MLTKLVKATLISVIVFLIFYLVFLHVKLSLVRYFDADEFAHMHWGYSFLIGERPYADFFYLFPPLFLYPVSFVIKIFGRTFESLVAMRVFMDGVYVLVLTFTFLISKRVRGLLVALISVFLFVYLPMPQDKMIEIRPDMLSLLFSLLGIYLFMLSGNTGIKKKSEKILFLLSGFSYGLSLAVVPKTLFLLFPIFLVLFYEFIKGKEGKLKSTLFVVGLVPPALFVLLFAFWSGKFALSLYSMTTMASTLTDILGHKFYMAATHWFWPTEAFYGYDGWNPGIITTFFIFFLGSLTALVSGLRSLSHDKREVCLNEFLLFGSFFISFYSYVKIFPLKHSQYWIPAVPFLVIYFSSLITYLSSKLRKINSLLPYGVLLSIILYLGFVGIGIYQKKSTWTNQSTEDKLSYFLKTINKNEPVFDMTGETIFYPNGYYFCCVPYGQYEEGLGFEMPDIGKDMKVRLTRYVHAGYEGRIDVLPIIHKKYILENFKDTGMYFLMKKNEDPL